MLTHPDLQRSLEAIDAALQGLSTAVLEQRPLDGWSIAQIAWASM